MSTPPDRLEIEQTIAIAALASAIELHDVGTPGHNARVADLAVAIGHALQLDPLTLHVLGQSGLLHDLGKLGISDVILYKTKALSPTEQATMQQHPSLGLDVLDRIGSLDRVKQVIFSHHERLDGSGYPRHLVGNDIPLEARILAVADTYDAMISDRPYRASLGTAAALSLLAAERARTLDSDCVDALVAVVTKGSTRLLPSLAVLPFPPLERRHHLPSRRRQGGRRSVSIQNP